MPNLVQAVPRPVALPVSAGNIPEALKALDQWVLWRYAWRADQEHWTKPPYQRSGQEAKSNDARTWTRFGDVWDAYQSGEWDGVGFVVQEGQGLVGIDLDHCRDAESGAIDAQAVAIVRAINSYTEVSPSGHGLRIFVEGTLPPDGRKKGSIEMYQGVRYFTITGNHLADTPTTIDARPEALLTLHRRIFQRPERTHTLPRVTSSLSDDEVMSRALAAKNAGKVSRLWAGDLSGYASHSEADLALCGMLAFWTQDQAQLDRLFRRSQLLRDKWDERHGDGTYGARTIARACERAEVWSGLSRQTPETHGADTAGVMGVEDIVEDRLIWVTSPAEKALIQSAGYRSCLAIPGIPAARAEYRRELRYLKPLEAALVAVKKHLLLMPDTLDGRALAAELARRLGPEKALMPVWPSECESIEHIVTVHGVEVLQEVIEHPKRLPLQDVVDLVALRQRLHDLYRTGGMPRGLSTGWPSLDAIYRVRPGQITLVLGQPSTGKSTWTSALMAQLIEAHRWPIAVFSPEQAPPEQYATTFLEQWTGAPFDDGPRERMSLRELDQAVDQLDDYVALLWPDDKPCTVDYLLRLARQEVFRRGIKGLVIDPWGEIEHDYQGRDDLYIGAALTKIRHFARTHGVHVWIVVHPKQLLKDANNTYPVPSAYDIAGGAKWRDKADNILSLWRDLSGPESHVLQIHTQKIRFRQDGQLGKMAKLIFHPATSRYSEVRG